MFRHKQTLGNRGEDIAVRHLKKQGLKVLIRNYRNHMGEIDIICRHKNTLVFVEVKTSTSYELGLPIERVDKRKQEKIIRCALSFIKEENCFHTEYRFDVIGIIKGMDQKDHVTYIPNAFPSEGYSF